MIWFESGYHIAILDNLWIDHPIYNLNRLYIYFTFFHYVSACFYKWPVLWEVIQTLKVIQDVLVNHDACCENETHRVHREESLSIIAKAGIGCFDSFNFILLKASLRGDKA
jgi:hypothetical protein